MSILPELHPHVVNLLEAPDKQVDPDDSGAVHAVSVGVGHVLSLSLGKTRYQINVSTRE